MPRNPSLKDNNIVEVAQFSGGFSNLTYLIKTDAVGSLQWNKTYFSHPLLGSSTNSCKQLVDSSYIVCGSIFQSGPLISSFIFKADNSGNLQWYKLFNARLNDISMQDSLKIQK